ncbi:class I SAM-dependent methyltransferase [Paracoccus sp. (in: a-proteobacteria)]|uniref:class I SAM-dependent methyltransferase n=1 Tax=Paracoccus sp. TaxID=267 RepID=UPI0026E0FB82|nr:class I SAM-dependent methyltransferase [Paracoccus sp. (in: a-proteobacteria)]MDO5646894.1 class I SAM-dependent methyltransferase [Paracoccus sp. (in: a-proteobacteria)]
MTQTRLCDLPWRSFSVRSAGPDRVEAAPCCQFDTYPLHMPDTGAQTMDNIGAYLAQMRNGLRRGRLSAPCQTCAYRPWGRLDQLAALIDGKADRNHMLDALRDMVADMPPAPPTDQMYRVAHTVQGDEFILSGLVSSFDLLTVAQDHGAPLTGPVLDWGCGSGRMQPTITRVWPELDYWGCDIDAQAIAWCRDHLSGQFFAVDPHPPLPPGLPQFPLVLGFSVLTHLTRAVQAQWFAALRQQITDDGIAVLTIHGPTAARRHGFQDDLTAHGILDDRPDPTMDGIAPPGYYRATFQTADWTARHVAPHFTIADHIPGGVLGFQDIIVLKPV